MADQNKSDHDLLIQIAVDQKTTTRDIGDLKKAMFGNGRLGLKTRVEIMWYSFGFAGLVSTGWVLYKLTRG